MGFMWREVGGGWGIKGGIGVGGVHVEVVGGVSREGGGGWDFMCMEGGRW